MKLSYVQVYINAVNEHFIFESENVERGCDFMVLEILLNLSEFEEKM